MPSIDVRNLGDFIREQRNHSQISLRELAKQAGVSNPYLSQIERGLRKPSAEILQQIAKGLRISAEVLYVQAGFLEHREGNGVVPDAIRSDDALNERQKQVLLEIYDSFQRESGAAQRADPTVTQSPVLVPPPGTPDAADRLIRPASKAAKAGAATVGAATVGAAKVGAAQAGAAKAGVAKVAQLARSAKPGPAKTVAVKPGAVTPIAAKPGAGKPRAVKSGAVTPGEGTPADSTSDSYVHGSTP